MILLEWINETLVAYLDLQKHLHLREFINPRLKLSVGMTVEQQGRSLVSFWSHIYRPLIISFFLLLLLFGFFYLSPSRFGRVMLDEERVEEC
jgi:hypothetical protein